MFSRADVLFPTDFSHYALYALKYAEAFCRRYGGVLHLVHVIDVSTLSTGGGGGRGYWLPKDEYDQVVESMRTHAESRLEQLRERLEGEGFKVLYHIAHGNPAQEILDLAEELECGLVVIATHGRTGFDHAVFGSVCEKVVRKASMPVLSIKHPEHEFVDEGDLAIHVRRVLYPTDFSDFAREGLSYALSVCRDFDATLYLMHAAEIPPGLPDFLPHTAASVGADLEEHTREALELVKEQCEGVAVELVSAVGVPYREIIQAARASDADLVVLPTHGRSGLAHVLFGGVSDKVVRLAPCPVLTIRMAEKSAEAGAEEGSRRSA
jgi:nucleotide-binding universal stress UspA family protein